MIVKLSPQDIRRYNWYIWKFFIGCFVFFILLLAFTALGIFGALPSLRDLENPKSDQASVIYSSDNQILGKYFKTQNRNNVTFNQISPNVINALVAKEDNHFFSHSGIDFWRNFTIIPYNLLLFKKQGASTITQQLARNQFSDEERASNVIKRFVQKLKELIIAIRIERHYTKQEIITMYLNSVSFGSNTFGIFSAAQTYFNTTPDKLTPEQAATIIQTLTGPTAHSPIRHPKIAKHYRDFTLKRMVDEGYLSDAQFAADTAKPLGIDYHPTNFNEGVAPYFRATLRGIIKKLLKNTPILKADDTPYDIDRDGLKIYTTINYDMQSYAEAAQREYMRQLQVQFNDHWHGYNLRKSIKNYDYIIKKGMESSDRYKQLIHEGKSDDEIRESFYTPDTINLFTWRGDIDTVMKPIDSIVFSQMTLRNALMSMDPATGYIKAWVGGINFEHYNYDQVYTGARQVGSTAKPFTYAVAMEDSYSPCLEVPNVPDTIYYPGSRPWCPNSGKSETIPGPLTLRQALAHSQNWITAHLMKELTPPPVVELIKKMGITTPVPVVPSICLGTFDASVFDMTGAYCAFANKGLWTQPTFLLRIEDKNGNVIYEQHRAPVKQVLSEQGAYVMTYMLKGVIEEGTGIRLRNKYGFTNPIGGKTGTTNDNSDGWFIGITPQLVTGIWTGCENRDFHFRSQSLGEGANSALPIFALYMKQVYAKSTLGIKKNIDFTKPKDPLTVELDCSKYSQEQKGTNEVDKKLGF